MATILKHPTVELHETDMKNLIRNALMVAGHEMGETGDHWPVVKNTITDVMRDWEELEIERTINAELKHQMTRYLDDMQEVLKTCTPSVQKAAIPYIRELRDIYEAAFSPPDEEILDLQEDEKPMHIKRAEAIIDMLFDDSVMEESYA
ncbi:MAG: hypothetical protein PHD48_03405 [Alphaproteobacteria bacterium]|nr:hypothetical protein [Alphaproteobacteria bacterium]